MWIPLGDHLPLDLHPVPPAKTKRVPICSFLNSESICILIKTWNWNGAKVGGKNWDTDAHAHMTYQAPTTGLRSPALPLLQTSTDYLMLARFSKFGVNCCFIGLAHPAVWTQARVPLTFGHIHRPPLYSICSKWVPINWAWAGDSGGIFKIPWVAQKCFGFTPNIVDLPRLDPYKYRSIALDARIPNIQFLLRLTYDVQKFYELTPPAVNASKSKTYLSSTDTIISRWQ